ncbi:transposase [Streptomyces sp. NPDC059378]|uniref:transposase n=1 Tax=Streptomyces sp. NPDC059378 TaxID=3346815 RepID=UPI0036AC1A72
MTCYRPGQRSRLFYAVRQYNGRKDQPKGFGWRDFRDLIVRARIQLGGPIVLVWDNVRLHLTKQLREFIDANAEWLTVFQLPTYAPDLNPTEGVWSLVKRDIGNLAAASLDDVTRAVKRRLKRLQYRPDVIDGCMSGTGLALDQHAGGATEQRNAPGYAAAHDSARAAPGDHQLLALLAGGPCPGPDGSG